MLDLQDALYITPESHQSETTEIPGTCTSNYVLYVSETLLEAIPSFCNYARDISVNKHWYKR